MSKDRPRVLVVDDDEDAAGMMRSVLADRCEVSVAHSVSSAVAAWMRDRPALLIVDLHLGGMRDGIDVFQEIRRQTGSSPRAIVVSGAAEAASAGRALGVPVLYKPFDIDELYARVDAALA